MKLKTALFVSAAAILLAGCSTTYTSLNDPSKAVTLRDVAPITKPSDLPYEMKKGKDLEVGMNIRYLDTSNTTGYLVTVIFRNGASLPYPLLPKVLLVDGAGFVVKPHSQESFSNHAAALAGAPQTEQAARVVPQDKTHTGTIVDTSTGTRYTYQGTTSASSGGAADGFMAGMQDAAVQRQRNERREGILLMEWANTHWLKDFYDLPPGRAVAGVLVFPSKGIGQLPLKLTVSTGFEKFEFETVRTTK